MTNGSTIYLNDEVIVRAQNARDERDEFPAIVKGLHVTSVTVKFTGLVPRGYGPTDRVPYRDVRKPRLTEGAGHAA